MSIVRLSNAKKFTASASTSILEAGRAAGIVLEHSCRNGQCGVCKTQVLSGETSLLQPELSLSGKELEGGYVLTCCRNAISDVQLDAEDLGSLASIGVQTLPCRINSLTLLAEDVLEVSLRTPPTSKLHYLPGQYLDIIAKNGVRRSYSIASAPREDGVINLQLRRVDGGELSHYWFNEARHNDLLRLEGPLGTFCLRDLPSKHLVFLATGTGIAPIRAMLEQIAADPISNPYEDIKVYWGNRFSSDIYWEPDMKGLGFSFIPVVSREPDWAGRRGHVQEAALGDIEDFSGAVVYACGSDLMIRAAREALIGAGLPRNQFYSDAFVQSGGVKP